MVACHCSSPEKWCTNHTPDYGMYALNNCDSLPSPTESVQTWDESPTGTMNEDREDVNDVLNEVINKINRITDHLRSAGESEAANHFTKEMTTTLRHLYNVIAPWDIEKCLMSPQPAASSTESRPQSAGHVSRASGNTWASIAATEPVVDKNGIIKFRPSNAVKHKVRNTEESESGQDAQDMRVVWISPWPEARSLSNVSRSMSDIGALYSMAYVPNEQAVCVIFQKASAAHQFLHICGDRNGQSGSRLFGGKTSLFPGVPFPTNDDIRRMDSPYNERRRLTFARAQLFCNGINESKFRQEVEETVGAQNVELLWLFNTGNATVVFSAVPLAKMVREKFLRYSRTKKHPYEGVMVSYSHDPCERDMHLVSQIPGHANFIGNNGSSKDQIGGRPTRSNTFSTATSTTSAPSRRMSTASTEYQPTAKHRRIISRSVDDDGWQTVHKKKR